MKSKEEIELAEKQIFKEQQDVDYDTREFTIEYIVNKYLQGEEDDKNEIYVPDYQPDFVWDIDRQSKLIESIILGLPIPILFIAENPEKNNRLEIVDGSQRIRTLAAFIENEFKLQNLEKLSNLNGFSFSDLSERRQRKFKNTPLRMIVLSDKATDEIRNDIFERINRGSDLLRAMEKRKGINSGIFTDFIYNECANNDIFCKLTKVDKRQEKRQEREELILRFFALSENYNNYPQYTGIARFLDDYLDLKNEELKKMSDNDCERKIEKYRNQFIQMLEFVYKYFKYGFCKSNIPQVSRVYFEAISVGVHCAISQKRDLIYSQEMVESWLNSTEFKGILSEKYHTHTPKRIKDRIEYVTNKLLVAYKNSDQNSNLLIFHIYKYFFIYLIFNNITFKMYIQNYK